MRVKVDLLYRKLCPADGNSSRVPGSGCSVEAPPLVPIVTLGLNLPSHGSNRRNSTTAQVGAIQYATGIDIR